MKRSSLGDRVTAVISSFVAVGLIGAFVVADRTSEWPAVNLPGLEADVRMQFDLAYRHDLPTYEAHVAGLEAAVEAFRNSPQSPADQALLTEWFEAAIANSMPGGRKSLPPTPKFGPQAQAPVANSEPQPLPKPAQLAKATASDVVKVRKPPIPAPAPRTTKTAVEADVIAEPAPRIIVGGPVPTLAPEEREVTPPTEVPIVVASVATSPKAPAVPRVEESIPIEKPRDEAPAPVAEETTPISVNLAELRARIAGYHAGLRELNAAAVNAGEELTLSAATKLVAEFEELARQREFVSLYYESLTPAEQSAVAEPHLLQETAAVLVQAIDRAAEEHEAIFDPFTGVEQSPFAKLVERVNSLSSESAR